MHVPFVDSTLPIRSVYFGTRWYKSEPSPILYLRPPQTALRPPQTASFIRLLPPDILIKIFHIHQGLPSTVQCWEQKAELFISQICRSWRELTLSSPVLWRFINIRNPQLAREFLARSKGELIYLVTCATNRSCEEDDLPYFEETFRDYASQVEGMDVFLTQKECDTLCSIGPFPNLIEASIHTLDCHFDTPLNSVRRLSLFGMGSLNWANCSGLTNLCVGDRGSSWSVPLSGLLDCLARCQQLVSLRWCRVGVLVDEEVQYPVVSLPSLRELKAESRRWGNTMLLLFQLSVPPSATFRFRRITPLDVYPLFLRPAQFPNLRLDEEATLQLNFGGLQLRKRAPHPWTMDWEVQPSLSLDYTSNRSAYLELAIFCGKADLKRVKTIEIGDWGTELLGENVEILLSATPNLETLRVSHINDLTDILKFLKNSYPFGFMPYPCPKLKTLTLTGPYHPVPNPEIHPYKASLVMDCIRFRVKGGGSSLKTVQFNANSAQTIDDKMMSNMKDYVEVIIEDILSDFEGQRVEHNCSCESDWQT